MRQAPAPRSPTLVIEQPSYIPWLGYFDLLAQADVWVWYDDVQYTRRDWRNRNRVDVDGRPTWLTVPVRSGPRSATRICDVEIDASRPWPRRHLETLRHCYSRAPHFREVIPVVEASLLAGHSHLAPLVIELNEALCRLLGLTPAFQRSSELEGIEGARQERLLQICRRLRASTYLSGPAAHNYIAPGAFRRAGIELRYIVYQYPPYERGGAPFVPGLSILDALCWMGPSRTRDYLLEHGRSEPGEADALPRRKLDHGSLA
jgi:hypothetical protein